MGKLHLNKCIELCADYMSTGLWAHDGSMLDSSRIPISDDLFNELLKWTDYYDKHADVYDIGDKTVYNVFNAEHFSEWGRTIAERLQAELPDWSISYYNELTLSSDYVVDPLANRSLWQYQVELPETLVQAIVDWLDESGLEYHCNWPSGQVLFKTQQDAAYFTLRWL